MTFISCPPSITLVLLLDYKHSRLSRDLYFFARIPESQDISFGELKQGKKCLDTLGSQAGGSVGMFDCHGQAGNQVLVLYSVKLRDSVVA